MADDDESFTLTDDEVALATTDALSAQISSTETKLGRPLREAEVAFELAWACSLGEAVPQDLARAAMLYKKAADAGVVQAQYNLGMLYYDGRGVEQDYVQAAELFLSAATDHGHSDSQFSLGVMHEWGQGVPQDYARAMQLYKMVADKGVAKGFHNMGNLIANGKGVPADLARAARLFRRSLALGFEQSRVNLGLIEHDLAIMDAAAMGDAAAQTTLAGWYTSGRGVPQDYRKALELFEAAADEGDGRAQYNLGIMYRDGVGVVQDTSMARKWFRLAAAHGYKLQDELDDLMQTRIKERNGLWKSGSK